MIGSFGVFVVVEVVVEVVAVFEVVVVLLELLEVVVVLLLEFVVLFARGGQGEKRLVRYWEWWGKQSSLRKMLLEEHGDHVIADH